MQYCKYVNQIWWRGTGIATLLCSALVLSMPAIATGVNNTNPIITIEFVLQETARLQQQADTGHIDHAALAIAQQQIQQLLADAPADTNTYMALLQALNSIKTLHEQPVSSDANAPITTRSQLRAGGIETWAAYEWAWAAGDDAFNMTVTRNDGVMHLAVEPVFGLPFICSASFRVMQNDLAYDVKLETATGESYCDDMAVSGEFALTTWSFDPAPNWNDAFTLYFDGVDYSYWLKIPATASSVTHPLTIEMDGIGIVTSTPGGIDCPDHCSAEFAAATPVTLIANSDSEHVFVGWIGGGCEGADVCTVTMNAAQTVTASFITIPTLYSLNVNKIGNGNVMNDDGIINCGTQCAAKLESGSSVVLTATPASGYQFSGWSGAYCEGNDDCVVTMDAPYTITAQFTPVYALTVKTIGNGTVNSNDWTIDCATVNCTANFSAGSQVILTATPADGYQFTGWSGGGCAGTDPCVVAMNKAQTVSATFKLAIVNYTLTVKAVGSGAINSADGMIDCNSVTCAVDVMSGNNIVLIATPNSGYQFSGWSGACTNKTGNCTVTMNGIKAVTAKFTIKTVNYKLTAKTVGNGNMTSSDGLIDCGGDCTDNYASGSKVVLTATPASGYQFSGWSGACTNKTGSCTVTMSSAKTVVATFTIKTVNYQLTAKTVGNGSIMSSDGLIDCGGDCTDNYVSGSKVVLTATPDSGYQFSGWSGACTNKTGDCTVTMNSIKSVTATFAGLPNDGALTVKTVGNGNVTSSPAAINCGTGTNCTAQFNVGNKIVLTAVPATGERLMNWNGCVPNSTAPEQCRVTITAAHTVTATFSNDTTPAADVRVMSIAIDPAIPTVNESFTATIVVKNIGNITMDAGDMEVWANDKIFQLCGASGDAWAAIGTLAAGATKTVTVKLTATGKGRQRLHVFADSGCVSSELHEGNNQAVRRYTVK